MGHKAGLDNFQRLIVGFSIIILLLFGFGIFTLTTVEKLSELTSTIYNHPLVVSNAALQANASVTKMHRNMKDVVLFESETDVDKFIRAVNDEELKVYQQLDIVRDRILGQEGENLEDVARNQFADWKSIRSEVIELVKGGEKAQAARITIGKGAAHVALLEKQMLGLTQYARNKATAFMAAKDKQYNKAKTILILFLISSIVCSVVISYLVLRHTVYAENKLVSSEKRYRSLFKSSSDAIVLVEVDTLRLIDANEAAIDMYGYTYDELLQRKATDLSAEEDKTRQAIQADSDKSVPLRYHRKKNGTVFPVEITANILNVDNKRINISNIRDISQRVESGEKIKKSLEEKEILLKEIHHRVKNNMQIIQSLLNLQINSIEELKLKKPLIDSESRIKSMALIHETLYQSENIAQLDIEPYYKSIVQHVLKLYKSPDINISPIIEVSPLPLNMDCCIATGLIINELVSNALKYAFPGRNSGALFISLAKIDDASANLVIRDDGRGLPDGLHIESAESLGLKIVRILVAGQMKGTLSVNCENGTLFDIRFPI